MGKELIMFRKNLKDITVRAAHERARKYIEKSCEKGHAPSFFYLGMIHELGIGVTVDMEKAIEFYNISKDKKDPQAFFKLGIIAQERGDQENDYLLMRESAELGLLEGQHNLACYYMQKEEYTKALGWFLHAGKFDFYPSMINIGNIFMTGKGKIQGNPMAAYI